MLFNLIFASLAPEESLTISFVWVFSKHQPDCRKIWRTIEKSNNNLHCLSWVSYFAASNIICNFTSLQLFVLSKNVDQPSEQRVRYLRLMLKHADNSTTFKCSSIRIDVKARSGQFHHYQMSSSPNCVCVTCLHHYVFSLHLRIVHSNPPFKHNICTVNSVRLSIAWDWCKSTTNKLASCGTISEKMKNTCNFPRVFR